MYKFPIGIILDSFRKPFPEALDITRSLGAQACRCTPRAAKCLPKT